MRSRGHAWLVAAAFLVGCGGPPAPGQPGYPYNVEGEYSGTVSVEGQGFQTMLRFTTEEGGTVSGTWEVTQPIQMAGVLSGTLLGDQVELSMPYSNNPMTGCSGELAGTLTVEEGGGTLSGGMSVADCGDMLSASVRFTRRGM